MFDDEKLKTMEPAVRVLKSYPHGDRKTSFHPTTPLRTTAAGDHAQREALAAMKRKAKDRTKSRNASKARALQRIK